jgi:hypothetical protein
MKSLQYHVSVLLSLSLDSENEGFLQLWDIFTLIIIHISGVALGRKNMLQQI